MRSVTVMFPNSGGDYNTTAATKLYEYFCDVDVREEDLVVVKSQYGYKVCKVTKCNAYASPFAKRHIIQKVNLDAYEKEIEKREEKANLFAMLERMEAERKQQDRFDELARVSPDAAILVEKLKSL